MPEKTAKVSVSDRWRVVHDGKAHTKGDTLTVPNVSLRSGSAQAG